MKIPGIESLRMLQLNLYIKIETTTNWLKWGFYMLILPDVVFENYLLILQL